MLPFADTVRMELSSNQLHQVTVEFIRDGITSPSYKIIFTHENNEYVKGLLVSTLDAPTYRIFLLKDSPRVCVTNLSQTLEEGMTFTNEKGKCLRVRQRT